MKLLLDTHVLVWALSAPDRLSITARRAILSQDNELLASHVSLWELASKAQTQPGSIPNLANIEEDIAELGVRTWVPIQPAHIFGTMGLPPIHRDPFDRLLLSQARSEGFTLVTKDSAIQKYPVSTLW